jgi:hypothetical protein
MAEIDHAKPVGTGGSPALGRIAAAFDILFVAGFFLMLFFPPSEVITPRGTQEINKVGNLGVIWPISLIIATILSVLAVAQ